ncbi:MAG: C39 family peptidase [Rhabdochlamydiaceae bacterium]|nr:C39 family peptidase [Candidatus Amphrikana amoebophyrae]
MDHYFVNKQFISNQTLLIKKDNSSVFNELIISWKAKRPINGAYYIYVRIKTDNWSSWFLYATWDSHFQKSNSFKENDIRINQDCIEIINGKIASGYNVKIEAKDGAKINELQSIHVCPSNLSLKANKDKLNHKSSSTLKLEGLSQFMLVTQDRDRLCSPTSTTCVVNYLTKQQMTDPIHFAKMSYDMTCDVYGNWVFNVAHANSLLIDSKQLIWVQRLKSFQPILDNLEKELPTVISVRGPLNGSAQPYKEGHLMVVIGYDYEKKEVICMDPAFETNIKTVTRYTLESLLKAWDRRGKLAFVVH